MVIAIIALLMGILFPVLRKAREQGRDVVCRNNLRQIGLAANFYADHYGLYIPRSAEWGGNIKPWFQLFMPFLAQKPIDDDYRNVEIFRCPSYPDKEQTVCYVVNGWGGESNNGWRMQSVPVRGKVQGREVDIPNFKSQMLLCEARVSDSVAGFSIN